MFINVENILILFYFLYDKTLFVFVFYSHFFILEGIFYLNFCLRFGIC